MRSLRIIGRVERNVVGGYPMEILRMVRTEIAVLQSLADAYPSEAVKIENLVRRSNELVAKLRAKVA